MSRSTFTSTRTVNPSHLIDMDEKTVGLNFWVNDSTFRPLSLQQLLELTPLLPEAWTDCYLIHLTAQVCFLIWFCNEVLTKPQKWFYLRQLGCRSRQELIHIIRQRLPTHRTNHRQLLWKGSDVKELFRKEVWDFTSQNSSDLAVHPGPAFVLLQLLLPLAEFALRVAGVAAQAVTVEIMVAACLGECLALLNIKQDQRKSFKNVYLPYSFYCPKIKDLNLNKYSNVWVHWWEKPTLKS